jgi:hypothetical protein
VTQCHGSCDIWDASKQAKCFEKMVGREGFEPSTIGLKVLIGEINGLYINELPGRPMHRLQYCAQLCITESRKIHA